MKTGSLEIKENCNSYTRRARNRILAKRIRAHDGCLGIGRRRRTRKTATSRGEPSTGFDPRVSEWDNPAPLAGCRRRGEHMAPRSHTRGSETSQYPEEEKSNEIARVVASESAGAQTGKLASRGCGTRARYRRGQAKQLESCATAGESPLAEGPTGPTGIPSRAEHVKLRPNPGGPPSKAEHYPMTDSELVPRGKGEKNRC